MSRDEYVTSLVLDHGMSMDQVRQKVIEMGFEPLPPEESGQSKRERLKEEMQHGIDVTKAALQAQFGKLTFYNDYVFEEGDVVNILTYFKLNNKEWALFGSAFEFQIDSYTIADFDDNATKKEHTGVYVDADHYGKPLVKKFVETFLSTDESTHMDIELPILEGKTYRHAITNPRDKRYIQGVDGIGPESDTQRMGIRDQAYVDQEQIERDLLYAYYDRVNPDDDYDYIPPADVNTSIQPRFYIDPSKALDDVSEDEIDAIDNGALETVDAGDPDELEHFDPEEESILVPLPQDFEEEDDDDPYFN